MSPQKIWIKPLNSYGLVLRSLNERCEASKLGEISQMSLNMCICLPKINGSKGCQNFPFFFLLVFLVELSL